MRHGNRTLVTATVLTLCVLFASTLPSVQAVQRVPREATGERASVLPAEEQLRIVRGAKDHTRVVRAVMTNAAPILKRLIERGNLRQGRKPTKTEVLQIILEVETIDASTKARVREALNLMQEMPRLQPRVAVTTKTLANEIIRGLHNFGAVSEMISFLRATKANRKYADHRSLLIGMEVAIEILKDGESTIYAEKTRDEWCKEMSAALKDNKGGLDLIGCGSGKGGKDVAIADAGGAIIGAVLGFFSGGPIVALGHAGVSAIADSVLASISE